MNGIGYEINTTAAACELLGAQPGKVKLHTYMQVREDGISLFGFPTRDELAVFKLVIGVSGIGPKGARWRCFLRFRRTNCGLPWLPGMPRLSAGHRASAPEPHSASFWN